MKPQGTRLCAACGQRFEYKREHALYCSRTCCMRARRQRDPEEANRLRQESRARMTPERREELKRYHQGYRAAHRDDIRSRKREYRREQRLEVLDWYGGRCVCCGEPRQEFLSMDHIDGGGSAHRREIKVPLVLWLWRQRGPVSGFRILCHNCNQSRGAYGYCPHERSDTN